MIKNSLLVLTSLFILLIFNTTAQGEYHQLGVAGDSSAQSNFDNCQGAASQIYVTDNQNVGSGAAHYFWPALDLERPDGGNIFIQMGYHTAGNNLNPFIYVDDNTEDSYDYWNTFWNEDLTDNKYYTFWFETDGVQNPDGTYDWDFWFAAEGVSDTKLTTLKLKSKNSDGAPYLFSEVAGSPDACSDSFSITYGSGGSINYALMGKRNNTWNYLGHVLAHYFYENCTSNINDLANQRHETVLPETRTTCDGCQVW